MNNTREKFIDLTSLSQDTIEVINSFIIGGFVSNATPEAINHGKTIQNAFKDTLRPLLHLSDDKLRNEFTKYFGVIFKSRCDFDYIRQICKQFNIDYNTFIKQCESTFDKYNWLDELMDIFIESFGTEEMSDEELKVYDNIVLYYEFKQCEQKAFDNILAKLKK